MLRLKELRNQKSISQKELAKIINVAQNTISQWENGDREPDNEKLKIISEIFNVSVDYLLGNDYAPTSKVDEIVEQLHKRPELKILFSKTSKASKQDIEKAVKIIELFTNEKD